MAGKKSKWDSTPESLRKRKSIEITLSPGELEQLKTQATRTGMSRSAYIGLLISQAAFRSHMAKKAMSGG